MTVDEFIERNSPTWERLSALTRKAGKRGAQLTPDELEELVTLYQRTATHLSLARTRFADQALAARLTSLVGQGASVVYGTRPATFRAVRTFITQTFPAALWHSRWFVLAATLVFCIPGVAVGAWLSNDQVSLDAMVPPEVQEDYVGSEFADYYTDLNSTEFFSTVTTNNIQVGILAFASGVLLMLPSLFILAFNGLNVGVAGGMFHAVDDAWTFWSLILPHGLLELTAVFIAGAAGLRLGWALISPGDRRRGDALIVEGRRAVAIVIGLVGVFTISGLIEGYITGAPWPIGVRLATGAAIWLAFMAYAGILGYRASRQGLTGELGEQSTQTWNRQLATGA